MSKPLVAIPARRPLPALALLGALLLLGGCALGDLGDVPAVCGDGLLEGVEECDDGNRIDGDGCSTQCLRVGQGSEGLCSNGLDDDADTLFDCNDPDCADDSACAAPPPVEDCTNAADDDGDGQIDCTDTDCTADPVCSGSGESLCGNARDDDGDGQIDCLDPDCATRACDASGRVCAASACACPGGATESSCTDRADNDCDGQLDCRDADCAGDAACTAIEDVCNNGQDDDGDGQADCADTNCAMEPCGPNGRRCQGAMCVCPGGATETACQDGRDNDCDGALDCADTDCASAAACMQRESSCGDGLDNDSDDLTDCADLDCDGTSCGSGGRRCVSGACSCPGGGATESSCTDGLDDDCDGQLDCADTDCAGDACGMHGRVCDAGACACPGGATETVCANGTDDDCDGLADCDDPDCSAAAGCSEVTCGDGTDNDLDGDADCLDADCTGRSCGTSGQLCASFACSCPGGSTESSCTNAQDDDCDGDIDCDDTQCAADPACDAACDIDDLLLCNFPVSHTTAGFGADVSSYSCGATNASGAERVYTFLATTNSSVTFRLSNPSADLDLYLLSGGTNGCNPQGCLDSSVATSGGETLTLQATAGTLYEVAVDGKAGASGTYDLSFECTGGTSCAASAVADCGFSEIWTTTEPDATDRIDGYSCTGWNESGPEYTYLFIPQQSGTATISVDSSIDPLGADLDVFVLAFNNGVCDATQCLASGDTSASLAVTAGELYLVVVDGYSGDAGDFSITFSCQ